MESKETKPKPKISKDENSKAKDTQSESTADDSTENRVKKKQKKKLASSKHRAGTKKHQKVIRDADAPKYPFTGYVRFSNERREELKRTCPELSVLAVTKKMAEEWNTMSLDKKKPFLDAAEIDKQRYNQEMKEYQEKKKKEGLASPNIKPMKRKHNAAFNGNTTTNSESSDALNNSISSTIAWECSGSPQKVAKDKPKNGPPATLLLPPSPPTTLANINQTGDIPIFTDQFLEHNRRVESELRQLRKSNTDYEQQNSVLEKHIESMSNGISKMNKETEEIKKRNDTVEQYLQQLRSRLAGALSGLAIPSKPGGANIENIDAFMDDLVLMANSNSHGPASLNKAKDIIRKLDLNI